MNAQKDKVVRDLDTNIYKIMDSYRQLLKKSQVNTAGEVSTHEELQVEAATTSISYHARAILNQIHDLRMHLLLQSDVEKESQDY